jgi:thiamine-phosphate pyrophosphorylase
LSRAANPLLCYVTDRASLDPPEPKRLLARIRQAAEAGVDWIQIREKNMPARSLADMVQRALETSRGGTRILVNDRLDVAFSCGADGVHLGAASLPIKEVVAWTRAHAPENFLVGASCHSLEESRRAELAGASYILFGPVFATPSKIALGLPQGAGKLAEVCRALRIPVLAIGGVDAKNAAECVDAGAAGIAAIRLFQQAENFSSLIAALHSLRA